MKIFVNNQYQPLVSLKASCFDALEIHHASVTALMPYSFAVAGVKLTGIEIIPDEWNTQPVTERVQ